MLCSHTLEHVENPALFYNELTRVGKEVTVVIPPLWDICAVLNIFEHKWIFLNFKKEHKTLPKYIKLPLSCFIQKNSVRGFMLNFPTYGFMAWRQRQCLK